MSYYESLIINKFEISNFKKDICYYNDIINKHYNKLFINCNDINGFIDILIFNDFISIYINSYNIISVKNCKLKEIYILNCNLIEDNKLNLEIKDCNNLKKILFGKSKNYKKNINFTNLKINILNCKLFNQFIFDGLYDINKLNQLLDIIYNLNLSFNKLYFYFYDCNLEDNIKYYNEIKKIIIQNNYIDNFEKFKNLEYLKLINYEKNIHDYFINLKTLIIEKCNNIKEIPDKLLNLRNLVINNCDNIKNIPNNFINLKYLKLIQCKNINKINNLINLKKLVIDKNIIPYNLINLKNLEINVNCDFNIKIPKSLINLEKINIKNNHFYINNFNIIFPNVLINLKKLFLKNYYNLNNIPNSLLNLKELKIKIENNFDNSLNIDNKYINLSNLYIYSKIDYTHYYDDGTNDGTNKYCGSLLINIKDKDKINNYINKTNGNLFYNFKKIEKKFNNFNLIKYNDVKEKFYYKDNKFNVKKYISMF